MNHVFILCVIVLNNSIVNTSANNWICLW